MMERNVIFIFIGIVIIGVIGFLMTGSSRGPADGDAAEDRSRTQAFVQCLADSQVVVYASRTCPACQAFVGQFGGYAVIEPIYVECAANPDECEANMKTEYVPEIQIAGELFSGDRTLEGLAEATGCRLGE